MRQLTGDLQRHLEQGATRLAVCWRILRQDGVLILGTQHDQDLEIDAGQGSPGNELAGTYLSQANITASAVRSTSDLSVDNLEVAGAVSEDSLTLVDVSAADLEAGLLDDADCTLFVCRWDIPNQGQVILRTGTLGNVRRTSDGAYTSELRGLTQKLAQSIVRTYGVTCDADLGDTRCGVSLGGITTTGTVTSVTSRRRFNASLAAVQAAGYFDGGLLTFTSGANSGYAKELRRDAAAGTVGQLELYEVMPAEVAVGDTFTLRPGCDKTRATCKAKFSNLVNFRGHGVYIPGQNEVLKTGGQ